MIHVNMQPEPVEFDALVRHPGASFLMTCPTPTTKEFKTHSYWRALLSKTRELYGAVCAYGCHYVPADTGVDTIEHFRPKSKYPSDAYEWSNYRFVCGRLNGRKGNHEDVLDPFHVENGWFVIEFPSLLVKPAPNLEPDLKGRVRQTCERLGLNDEGTCLKQRYKSVEDFCLGRVRFDLLETDAPFLAAEITRQGLRATLIKIMQFPAESTD